jgi:ligand-binding SRPBCC domain-containing protein
MKTFHFDSRLWVPRPRREVFGFFSDARNLGELTPHWLKFRIVSRQPILMHRGADIDYRLKLRGLPIRWQSRITLWDPPYRFVDEQVRGPYRVWIHEHHFREESGGTWCEDHVSYAPPGGTLINVLFVARDVRTIFEFRSQRLKEIFPS